MSLTTEKPLTYKQERFYRALRKLAAELRRPPTLRELQDRLQFASPSGCYSHLEVLAARGLIVWTRSSSRGITLVEDAERRDLLDQLAELPVDRLKELVRKECA